MIAAYSSGATEFSCLSAAVDGDGPLAPPAPADVQQIADDLAIVYGALGDDDVVELRALPSASNPDPATCQHFSGTGIYSMAESARLLSERGRSVYFVLNPLSVALRSTEQFATDGDVTRRTLLLIDIDPARPSGVSATDAEKELARQVALAIVAFLRSLGWPLPVVADSGNGWHLLFRIDQPNNTASRNLLRQVLRSLHARFADVAATVDTSVYNASRLCKLYGTVSRKGAHSVDRPHRVSRIVEVPDEFLPVPLAKLEELAAEVAPQIDVGGGAPSLSPTVLAPVQSRPPASAEIIVRASAYVSRIEGAVAGQGGHDKTFRVACILVRDFGLIKGQAWPLLVAFNARCQPPWSNHELQHKLDDADEFDGPRGRLAADGAVRRRLTDLGNAERLIDRVGPDVRHCGGWKKWLAWDGRRFANDDRGMVDQAAYRMVRSIYGEAEDEDDGAAREALVSHARKSEAAAKIAASITLAKKLPGVPICPEELNRHRMLLNCPNGTLDLATGTFGPHRRSHLVTQLCPTPYDPVAVTVLAGLAWTIFDSIEIRRRRARRAA